MSGGFRTRGFGAGGADGTVRSGTVLGAGGVGAGSSASGFSSGFAAGLLSVLDCF